MGNSVKGFTKVKVENIHNLPLIHQVDHLVIEQKHNLAEAGQAGEDLFSGKKAFNQYLT